MFETLKNLSSLANVSLKGNMSNSPENGWVSVLTMGGFGDMFGKKKLSKAQIREIYRGWIYACINVRKEDIGNLELQLFEIDRDGETLNEIKEHALLDLLYSINQGTTKNDAFGLIEMHESLFGEAYWKHDKITQRIIPLMPDSLTPFYDNEGVIVGWKRVWTVNEKQFTENLTIDDVIPFKDIDPLDPARGLSKVSAIYDWIETEMAATEWNRNFFRNNAMPAVVFESENNFDKTAQAKFLESFKQEHQGVEKAHRLGMLPKGVKPHVLSQGHKDMEFEKLDERFQNKILSAFGVPRTRLGITEDVNRANAEATNYVYMLRTIKPRIQHIVDTLNEYLVPKFGDNLVLGFVSPVPEDRVLELEERKVALGGQPYATINEIRKRDGLGEIDEGNVVYVKNNMIPIAKSLNPDAVMPAKTVALIEEKKLLVSQSQRMFGRVFKFRKSLTSQAAKLMALDVKDAILNIDMDEVAHKAFVSRVEPFIPDMKDVVLAINKKVEDDVNATLEAHIAQGKTIYDIETKDFMDNQDDILGDFVDAMGPVAMGLSTAEGQAVLESLGITGDFIITEGLKAQIEEKINMLVASYGQTTADMIKVEIERGLADGLALEEIRANIQGNVFDYANDVRAEMIANTETFRIANLATREAYNQSGVVVSVRWYTAEDERVCDECAYMNGQSVGVKEVFLSKGDPIGDTGATADYDDVMGGALHVNCRCYTRPDEVSMDEPAQ